MVVYYETIFFYRANYGHFRQLRLVSIRPALNQTQRCSAVRSHLFELARDRERERRRERERERDSCVCEPASARLSLQAMRLTSNTVILPPHCREI